MARFPLVSIQKQQRVSRRCQRIVEKPPLYNWGQIFQFIFMGKKLRWNWNTRKGLIPIMRSLASGHRILFKRMIKEMRRKYFFLDDARLENFSRWTKATLVTFTRFVIAFRLLICGSVHFRAKCDALSLSVMLEITELQEIISDQIETEALHSVIITQSQRCAKFLYKYQSSSSVRSLMLLCLLTHI